MKLSVVSLVLAAACLTASSPAFALRVYKCEIGFTANASSFLSGQSEKKSVVLLEGHRSLISSDQTLSSIDIAIGADRLMRAYLPNERVYPLREDVRRQITSETFAAPLATIQVSCARRADVSVAYINSFTRTVTLKPVLGSSTYIGDTAEAARAFKAALGLGSKITEAGAQRITVVKNERQCLKGHGTNPDDYECESYGNVDQAYRFKSAAALPPVETVCVKTKIVTGPPTGPGEDHSTDIVCAATSVIQTRGL